ncbi:MAG: pilus assembly protein, partial [Acidobacteria bacterium]|nr:pilus assembly protein [Acidobacteriota bacterium]
MTHKSTRQRGAAIIEIAFILVALLMLLFAIFDLGQYLFMHHMLNERIRSAVRRSVALEFNATSIQNLVLYNTRTPAAAAQPYLGLARTMVVVERFGAGTAEDRIRVIVQGYRFKLVTPFLSQYGYTGKLVYWLPLEKISTGGAPVVAGGGGTEGETEGGAEGEEESGGES